MYAMASHTENNTKRKTSSPDYLSGFDQGKQGVTITYLYPEEF